MRGLWNSDPEGMEFRGRLRSPRPATPGAGPSSRTRQILPFDSGGEARDAPVWLPTSPSEVLLLRCLPEQAPP
jgi:hypothetical protein